MTGGGARSQAYRQVLADLLRKPVFLLDAPEATARGACVQAAAVLQGRDIRRVREEWRPPVLSVCEPRPGAVHSVQEGYARLAELTEIVRED